MYTHTCYMHTYTLVLFTQIYIIGPLLGSIGTSIFYHFVIAGDASPLKFVEEMKDLCRDFVSSDKEGLFSLRNIAVISIRPTRTLLIIICI